MKSPHSDRTCLPDWLTPGNIETVIFAFPDVYGRLMGKRMTRDYFLENALHAGMHVCNYLMTVDMDMNPQDGFAIAGWEKGFGDFHLKADLRTLRPLPWEEKTAMVLGNMYHENGEPVRESPRQVLADQIQRLAAQGLSAYLGSELEFYLFDETYHSAHQKGYLDLVPASDYGIDYHILQPGRDEDVIGRIRTQMNEAGIEVECSKGETAKGQHEINLRYAEAMEMADRHVIYKTGAKTIAGQNNKAVSFMAKLNTIEAGNGFHIHTSLWDAAGKANLFWAPDTNKESDLFHQFLGGILKYGGELSYFFAPTINAYKRYQAGSWAPTAIVCGRDNRTCGYRVVGNGSSLRIENRMPGADANPYLAFAATIAAGLRGIEEDLHGDAGYTGNAYKDEALPRLPRSLDRAADLLEQSEMARKTFGTKVIDFYVHTARLECDAFRQAVTNWEYDRYFEQI